MIAHTSKSIVLLLVTRIIKLVILFLHTVSIQPLDSSLFTSSFDATTQLPNDYFRLIEFEKEQLPGESNHTVGIVNRAKVEEIDGAQFNFVNCKQWITFANSNFFFNNIPSGLLNIFYRNSSINSLNWLTHSL